MKRIMIVATITLMSLSVWIIKESKAQKDQANAQKYDQQKNWFEINAQGTLKIVRNKKGEIIFGADRMPNEGYSIAYQLLDPKTKKPLGSPRIFFAVGNHYSKDQLKCEECEKLWKRKRDQAIATVTDGTLRINSDFYYLEKEGKLKIVRTIENISNQLVQLIAIRTQYDSRLGSTKATQFGKVRQKLSRDQSPFLVPGHAFNSNFSGFASPNITPSCTACPPYCDLPLNASAGEKELICVDCPKDGSSVLNYLAMSIPVGQYPQTEIDKQRSMGMCQHSIIVDVWNGTAFVDGRNISLGEGEVLCVDCPKGGAENLIVQPVSGRGGIVDPRRNLRNSGLCQLAVDVDKGGAMASDLKNDSQLGPGEHHAVIVILDPERK